MNNLQEYIELSLIKNQNNVAICLSEFFSIKELEKINLSNISYNPRENKDNIVNILYNKKFNETNHQIQILEILSNDQFPSKRYLDIRLLSGKRFQIDIKCKISRKIISYLNIIVAAALNYSNYKSEYDKVFIRKNIINNFSKEFSKDASLEALEEIKIILDYINNDGHPDNYTYEFKIENIDMKIIFSEFGYIKLDYINTDTDIHKYIYCRENKTNMSNLSLIVEKALGNK